MRKVLGITGGIEVPSARFRFRQYITPLTSHEILLEESYTEYGSFYSESLGISKSEFVLRNLKDRFDLIYKQSSFDLIFLQREIISTLYTYEFFFVRPVIFDVDDAIFLNKRGSNYTKRISAKADKIICGNSYLANYYSEYNKNITIIPTPVDTNRYVNLGFDKDFFVLGWIGTSNNHWHLKIIEEPLRRILELYDDFYFHIISDKPYYFQSIDSERIINKKWDLNTEVQDINMLDVGVMPLFDTEWTRGKCSFKLLQYMSCGIPVIASPTGMNVEVISNSSAGYLASSAEDWFDYILYFYHNRSMVSSFGAKGRQVVIERYSLSHCAELMRIQLNAF